MEGPTARELTLTRINSATSLYLTIPCSLLSLTRFVFRPLGSDPLLIDGLEKDVGFPPYGRPRVGHSGDRRFGCSCGPQPTVETSAS